MTGGPNPSGLCQCGCGKPTTIAKRNHYNLGLLKGQHFRFIRMHAATKAASEKASAFSIEEDGPLDTPCRIWQGAVNSKGYAIRGIPGTRKTELVHRAALEELLGHAIPFGHQAHHRCEIRRCVNGEHLEPVTPKQHSQRHPRRKVAA